MADYSTVFGSLDNFRKGGVDIIDDDPKNYAFSNVFDVAARSRPYERVAVGKNFEYVIEAVRADGASPWYGAAHDEFALCMDGKVVVELVKLADPSPVPAGSRDRKSTRLNSSHLGISYAVFCLKKQNKQ